MVKSVRWSDIVARNEIDENDAAIRGYFLRCLGVDLEDLPESLLAPNIYYNTIGKQYSEERLEKVRDGDIIGTRYDRYASGTWLDTFARLNRASSYIKQNVATRGKYFHMLKQPNDLPPVKLCRDKNGDLFVGGNGNHRVTFYKLMAETDDLMPFAAESQLYRLRHLREPYQLYWLYAFVKDEL